VKFVRESAVKEEHLVGELNIPRDLGDGLTLRVVESDAQAEEVIAINAAIHGADAGDVVRHWFFHGHPTMAREDWLFIEDQETCRAVSTLSLMSTTWSYGGHPLPVAELGFVATHPDYRRRGLQRVLSDAFDEMASSFGFNLAAIEGIPGFYGQFGYEYAVPLMGGFNLDYDRIPDGPTLLEAYGRYTGGGYAFRRATPGDVNMLQRLYDASIVDLDIAAPRSRELWTYQLSVPESITFYPPVTVIEHGGRFVGYVRWTDDDWEDRLRIVELAVDAGPGAHERVLMALRFARDRGRAASKRGLKLQLPEHHPAVTIARTLIGVDMGYYGWQMKVLDPAGFMRTVQPALEARLARSALAGYSGSLVFQLYRARLALCFVDGALVEITAPESVEQADARMTLKQATQLWLGWRERKALEAWHPDFWTRETSRFLLDVLFPQTRAYIYVPY
jgi:GNAT superfamily N-acetyltransferase